MFFNKSFVAAVISSAMLIGGASAFTGTATEGFGGIPNCGCRPTNGPFAIAFPAALVPGVRCCNTVISLSYNGKTTTAIYSADNVGGAGTEDLLLSTAAFETLAGVGATEPISPVTWEVHNL